MKDIFGNVLEEGDFVATMVDGYSHTLVICQVIGFSKKKVRLVRQKDLEGYINGEYGKHAFTKFPEQVAKGGA